MEESFQDKEILDNVDRSTTFVNASLTHVSFCLFLAMNKDTGVLIGSLVMEHKKRKRYTHANMCKTELNKMVDRRFHFTNVPALRLQTTANSSRVTMKC